MVRLVSGKGLFVGGADGVVVGEALGDVEGPSVGLALGEALGLAVGDELGDHEGLSDGDTVGAALNGSTLTAIATEAISDPVSMSPPVPTEGSLLGAN